MGRPRYTDPKGLREPGDMTLRPREEFVKFRNYIDLFRATAGSFGVMHFGLSVSSDAPSDVHLVTILIQLAILVIAIAIQTFRWEGHLSLYAPMFFLTGVASGVCGIGCAVYGTAAAWVINALLPNPSSFLFAQGVFVGAFGAMFYGPTDPMVVIAGALTILPSFVGFMLRKPLTVGAKRIIKGA